MSEIPDLTLRQAADAMKAIKPSPHAPTNRKNLARAAAPIIAAKAREQALADATARIEELRKEPDPTAHHTHNAAIDAALAALNQPQTAFGLPVVTHPDVKPGRVGIVSEGEVKAVIDGGGAADAAGDAGGLEADVKFIASQLIVEAEEIEATRHLCSIVVAQAKRDASEVLQAALDNASTGTAPQEAEGRPSKDGCPDCGLGLDDICFCPNRPRFEDSAPVPQTEGEKACPDWCPDCGATLKPSGECLCCIHGIPGTGKGKA